MRKQSHNPIGVVEWFRLGSYAQAEQAIDQMKEIGVGHLRTHLSWADYHVDGGKEWFDWLLPKLADAVEVLPCLHYTPPSIAERERANAPPKDLKAFADFTDLVIDRYGACFKDIELWNEPNNLLDWDWRLDPGWEKFCTMIDGAAYWARQRGKRTVLGGLCPNDTNLLSLFGQRGLFQHIDVMGIHGFPGTWDSEESSWPGWSSVVQEIRGVVTPFNPNMQFWITETGYSTWRRDAAAQARRLLEVFDADVERVYWYALRDLPAEVSSQEGHHFDERHYHLGLYDRAGQPKLTARLLAQGGVECVEETLALARPKPFIIGRKPVVVTGGAGFIGSNVASSLAADGRDVVILDGLVREGVEKNLSWLRRTYPKRISAIIGDVRDEDAVAEAMREASGVFHFSAQVAVTSSLEQPREDFLSNLGGTINVLEEARRRGGIPVIYASTNKVYGNLENVPLTLADGQYKPVDPSIDAAGISEQYGLSFHTPYGCSKGAADQYVLDYARSFGLPAAVLRMSCIYGQHQYGNEDQGWVAHFAKCALQGKPVTIYGDGYQVRDILHVDDAVSVYRRALDNIDFMQGRVFNLGGGRTNAVSLLEVLFYLEDLLGRPVSVEFKPWRTGDQKYYVSDTAQLRAALGFVPKVSWNKGVERLVAWLEENLELDPHPAGLPAPIDEPLIRR